MHVIYNQCEGEKLIISTVTSLNLREASASLWWSRGNDKLCQGDMMLKTDFSNHGNWNEVNIKQKCKSS